MTLPLALTALSEAQRIQALKRFSLLRPFLIGEISQRELAYIHHLSLSTVQRWVRRYRQHGLAGLARKNRSDQGKRRGIPSEMVELVEGLALQKPALPVVVIYRLVTTLALQRNWKPPSYGCVYQIVRALDPALVTLAHKGTKAYSEGFDLVYQSITKAPNAMWQAGHILLDLWVLNERNQPARPWLTIIEDYYSRAIAGYHLSFQAPSTLETSLTLRQAIWWKKDPRWRVFGIPAIFYNSHGSSFSSRHLEQVAADLKIQLIFSQPEASIVRGNIERFFATMNRSLLSELPGFVPDGSPNISTILTLPAFETLFRSWLLEEYHHRLQHDIASTPQALWESNGSLLRMPTTLEQLDLLLLQVSKERRVQRDGIHFQGLHYLHPKLAAYVGKDVLIRYDPYDMVEILVFYRNIFLCRAECPELAGQNLSLKDIVLARNDRRKEVRSVINKRVALVEHFMSSLGESLTP